MSRNHPVSQQKINNGLTLNFCEVILKKGKFCLFKTEYCDQIFEKYKYDDDYYAYRDGKSLYVWETRQTDRQLPEIFKLSEIDIDNHALIFSKMIETAIVKFFCKYNYNIYKKKYSSIWEVELKHEAEKTFSALTLRPMLRFSVHNLFSKSSKKQVVALTIRRRYKPSFTDSEETIQSQLADTRGLTRNYDGRLVASSHNIRRYLEATGQAGAYWNFLEQVQSDEAEYKFLQTTTQNFNNTAELLYLPNGLEVDKFLLVNLPSASFQFSPIVKPRYYYYNERTKGGYYNKIVEELGPYSLDLFRNKRLRTLVITPDEYEGSVGEYIVKLQRNLKKIFHLNHVEFPVETVKRSETYLDVVNRIEPNDYDLAVIVVSQQDKSLPIPQSPYHLIKAKLLNQRLLTQDLTIEVIRQSNMSTDNNIALNVYSKLGGTAWTIEKTEKNISELIIGIGSTADEQGNWVIGFANVFDYNGTYLVGDCSQLSTTENYAENLERYLISILEKAFDLKGISPSDEVRLLFHLFKEAGKKNEIRAITNALQRFRDYKIKYGLVHLSYNHNFQIFLNQGKSRPNRGTFIQLSSRQALLHLGGKSVVPVQVRLDKRSGYNDIYAVTKQILYFAHLSYRTFNPPNKPVTIKYPSLMAKMVNELSQVQGWDITVLNRLNDKLWFI